ncbi:hypothetical protein [uncultured Gemmiger sp.]|uniref:hypothetical protein n=1 Tax=uncultured Gemmiger sp. TaxID=1623490 RepID=UPI0025F65241|nr:hypothetical protein [uncultured Gemmiger sp.]
MLIPILHSSFQLFPPLGRAYGIINYYFSGIAKTLQPGSPKNSAKITQGFSAFCLFPRQSFPGNRVRFTDFPPDDIIALSLRFFQGDILG